MSLEVTCKTNINDRAALVDTLKDLLGNNSVSVVEGGVSVTGYHSTHRPEVVITVPGLIGTAGYYKNAAGNYELVYDSMDNKRLQKIVQKKKGAITLDPVAQCYSKHKVIALNKKLRGRVMKNDVHPDGTIKIKIKVSHYG